MSLLSRCTRHTGAIASLSLLLVLGVAACGGDKVTDPPPPPPATTGSVAGMVRSGGAPLAGAVVRIGGSSATTGADGRFELHNVAAGDARLTCTKPGYVDYSANVTVGDGVTTTHDVTLAVREIYTVGGTSIFVPAGVPSIRGVIIAFGGPDVRCFVDTRIACVRETPPPNPFVEGGLQHLGASYRALAAARGLAVLGRESATSDQVIFDALSGVAAQSGRPELADAPFVAHGMSSGGPFAYGIAMRNPERAVGLVVRVSVGFDLIDPADSRSVPALVVTAGAEHLPGINTFNRATFEAYRTAGAPWAFAEEPGVPHHWASTGMAELVVGWVEAVFDKRLSAAPNGALQSIDEATGWLGDPATFEIAAWASYSGARTSASWLPSQSTAQSWRSVARGQ